MLTNLIIKTIRQYNKYSISFDDMAKLQEIANDYSKVKNYVYQRYGGIKSLDKIYPGYTVQNEMTDNGLRMQLDMPAVYFYLAVFAALGDIRSQWSQTKNRTLKSINQHKSFTLEEKHYLRFVIKVSKCFTAIVTNRRLELPKELRIRYETLTSPVDVNKLDNYLRRQVRKHLRKPRTNTAEGFSLTERAYRYGDHGIYISTKEKRKRIFVLLTDNNRYERQLYIKLYPNKSSIEIQVPVSIKVKSHSTYQNEIGLAVGLKTMLTTNGGNFYGEQYERYHEPLWRWIRLNTNRCRDVANNSKREKYYRVKRRLEAGLHTYINQELNRLILKEEPTVIYVPKMPQNNSKGINKEINHSMSLWHRGYIRRRLIQKCKEHSIKIIEIFSKNIGTTCSCCEGVGEKNEDIFRCLSCELKIFEKINTARNAKKRGKQMKINEACVADKL